jgi:hypothetical protein
MTLLKNFGDKLIFHEDVRRLFGLSLKVVMADERRSEIIEQYIVWDGRCDERFWPGVL